MATNYRGPKKFLKIFSAQVGKETDPGTYQAKLETLERKVNEACAESISDGFIPIPNPAIGADGNVVVFIGHDPRPLPGSESKIAIPNMVPAILAPPPE